jgi:hypothetical protein
MDLRSSSAKIYERFAPIRSYFNTEHTWVMEWQNDQISEAAVHSPIGLSKFLSISVLALVKEQCFIPASDCMGTDCSSCNCANRMSFRPQSLARICRLIHHLSLFAMGN